MSHPDLRAAVRRLLPPTMALAALGALAALAGCDRATAPGDALGLPLAPDSARLAWDDTLRLRAEWAEPGAPVRWSSSDTTVLRVDSTGRVTAVRGGAARVTARAGGRVGARDIAVDARFTALSAGFDASCGVAPSGRVLCWGRIVDSTGPGAGRGYRVQPAATPALGVERARDVAIVRGPTPPLAMPGSLTCATRTGAPPLCWGLASQGEQGSGIVRFNFVHPPTPIGGEAPLATVALGWLHACGLDAGGAAYCWGNADLGRLGHAQANARCTGGGSSGLPCQSVPAPVATALRFRQIAVGGAHSCAVTVDGRVHCWGNGAAAGTPAAPGSDAYASVAAGDDHSCAINVGGELRCWGMNERGQLGRGSTDSVGHAAPAPVAAPAGGAAPLRFRAVSAGTGFTCAAATDGRAFCWGANDRGQLGDGSVTARAAPTPVATPAAAQRRFVAVTAGMAHACALADDGAAFCWGDGTRGQLGNGVTASSSVPVRVGAPP